MSGTRGPGGGNDGGVMAGGLAATAMTGSAAVWAPIAVTDAPGYTGQGLFAAVADLIGGDITWTTACTAFAAGEAAVLALLAAGGIWAVSKRRRRSRIDGQARHMARAPELHHLSPQGVTASARRL